MNINPKTGKPWLNDYRQMYGLLFCSQNHKHIQLERYYDIIGRLEGKTKTMYAMILHAHVGQVISNRAPGMKKNVFMYVDTKSGKISSEKDMKEWMLSTGWMNCNAPHLLEITSARVWYLVYKSMLDIGLFEQRAGTLRCMVPIDGRFLPITYAYVAFLSRLKRDSQLNNAISKALADVPEKIRKNLEDIPKDELIDELINIKTEGMNTGRDSEVYRMLFEEVSAKYPHQWNDAENKNSGIRQDFLKGIIGSSIEGLVGLKEETKKKDDSEDFPGNSTAAEVASKIPEKIQEDKDKKEQYKKDTESILNTDDIHDFESSKRTNACGAGGSQKIKDPDLESSLFFAEGVTANDTKKVLRSQEAEAVVEPKVEVEEIEELPEFDSDIFGIKMDNIDSDTIEIPEVIEVPELAQEVVDEDEFWSVED